MSSATVAVVLAASSGAVAAGGPQAALRRLRPAPAPARTRSGRPRAPRPLPESLARRAPTIGAASCAALLLAGHAAMAVLVGAITAAVLVPQARAAARRRRREAEVARDLPRFADLLAGCLDAGAAPADAVGLVADLVGGPLRDVLVPVAGALRAGADPDLAWSGAALAGGPVQRLARALARACTTGAPLAATVATVAQEERERARWAAEAAARRAGVRAVGPLAVCFLPAFLLLGVVPVVASIVADVLTVVP